MGTGQIDDLSHPIEVAGVGVAGGGHDHRRSSPQRPERALERPEIEPANTVACERGHAPSTDAEHPQGFH